MPKERERLSACTYVNNPITDDRKYAGMCVCIYIYIYIHTHTQANGRYIGSNYHFEERKSLGKRNLHMD